MQEMHAPSFSRDGNAIRVERVASPDSLMGRLAGHRLVEALEKDRRLRYQSAADLRADLARMKRDSESGASAPAAATAPAGRSSRRRLTAVLAAAVLALAAAAAWWTWRQSAAREVLPPGHRALAVLYFSNLTQDATLNWLDRGLTEMLTTNLAQVKGIDLLSSERISAVLQRMGRKDGTLDVGVALEVARRAGADAFITGSLLRTGPNRLRLDVRAQSRSGQVLFSEKLEAQDLQGVFAMVDSVTSGIAQRFVPAEKLPEKGPAIQEVSTANVEAYRHYQVGLDYQPEAALGGSGARTRRGGTARSALCLGIPAAQRGVLLLRGLSQTR